MQHVFTLYPKTMAASLFAALVLIALLFVPPVTNATATTVETPIRTTAADTMTPSTDCVTALLTNTATCNSGDRKLRVIRF